MSRFGLSDRQYELMETMLRKRLQEKKSYTVWVFGSRARGDQKPFSDVDLLFRTIPEMNDREKTALENDFEESDFPFKIDVVPEHQVYPPYANQLEQEKLVVMSKEGN